ncbi:collagen alpha-4(vi) chain-like [Plakobranchus ocellatus]|uniref:Collagen alpha-4(Vi) chain-like n=1 Tax=Plakobranchus ocellatus TaxID=259542 RepID=A0AAV3ZRS9_9GAST|nr:collagen alpha-4(vi) chain-like [Plakobranchus ocellatus]
MIEYSRADISWSSVDHEGDYIKALIDEWQLDDDHIRIGVVVYHDDVTESIHLGDYSSKRDLTNKISSLTRRLRPSGTADLGKAIDHAREKSFVFPVFGDFVNNTPFFRLCLYVNSSPLQEPQNHSNINKSGIGVQGSSLDYDLVKDAVTQPSSDYAQYYRNYSEMEYIIKTYYKPNCDNK